MRIGSVLNRICLLVIVMMMVPAVYAQSQIVEHRLSDEERSLMPSYLESIEFDRKVAAPPFGPVRNIAEFEPMEGVIVAWPLGVPSALIAEMAKDVKVTTIVSGSKEESDARAEYKRAKVNLENCSFIHAPHDSYWTRDYGPWFIADGNGKVAIVDFTYNRPRPNDNKIPGAFGKFMNFDVYFMNIVHCGGNYMTDGTGISVSTNLILEENSSLTKESIENEMKSYLGIKTYHVTEDPLGDYIKHVDCWGKFLDVDKILIGEVPSSSKNYKAYEDMANFFRAQKSGYGNKYEVHRVLSANKQPYTNSLILNDKVLVPVSGSAADSDAIRSYEKAMPGYRVVGINGSWESTDALHCRVKEVADRNMVYIRHMPLFGDHPNGTFEVTATVVPYSKRSLNTVFLFYRVDSGSFQKAEMENIGGSDYRGLIPQQKEGSTVSYYIRAEDSAGNVNQHPFIGAPDPHRFTVKGGGNPDSPVAKISTDVTAGKAPLTVRFDGSGSSVPNGSIVSYEWNFGNGEKDKGQRVQYTFTKPGSFTVTLAVVSNNGGTDDEKVTITVKDENPAPIVVRDGFEGLGWKGGEGWKGPWVKKGDAKKITLHPYAGKKSARLRAKNGYLQRAFFLNGAKAIRIKFASKIREFENDDHAFLKVGPRLASLKTVKTFTVSDSDNAYHVHDINISEFAGNEKLVVVFDAEMNETTDYWYLDDVEVTLQP